MSTSSHVPAFVSALPLRLSTIPSRRAARSHRPTCSASSPPSASAAASASSMRPYLESLTLGRDLTTPETSAALSYVVSGSASSAEIGAFLALLAAKGETAAEVAGVAAAMRDVMVPVDVGEPSTRVLDIVGTGGDGAGTVNISTAASVVAAAAGCRVAKHGNRSVSSKCGSADVLEKLGVEIDITSEGVRKCVEEAGIGFMYAPVHHPAMKFVAPVRKALGVRTVFNIAGPLLNPASASCGVIGVYKEELLEIMGDALVALGMRDGVVVHSDGLDEFSNTGVAKLVEIRDGVRGQRKEWDPVIECGMKKVKIEELKGGDADVNADIIRSVLAGQKPGPVAEAIALNAGVGCYVYGLAGSMSEGVDMARAVLERGDAGKTLETWGRTSKAAKKV